MAEREPEADYRSQEGECCYDSYVDYSATESGSRGLCGCAS